MAVSARGRFSQRQVGVVWGHVTEYRLGLRSRYSGVSAQRLNSHQLAWAGAANGCTASLSPIALRIASKLLSAGLPFGESVR